MKKLYVIGSDQIEQDYLTLLNKIYVLLYHLNILYKTKHMVSHVFYNILKPNNRGILFSQDFAQTVFHR